VLLGNKMLFSGKTSNKIRARRERFLCQLSSRISFAGKSGKINVLLPRPCNQQLNNINLF